MATAKTDDAKTRAELLDELRALRRRLDAPADGLDLHRLQAQLLDSVRESVVATDLDERIIYWSGGATALYGLPRDEAMGRPYYDVIGRPERADAAGPDALRTQLNRHGTWHGQLMQRGRDGRTFWTDTVISLVADDDGRPCGYIGIDRDITAQKDAEAALRVSEDRLTRAFRVSPSAIVLSRLDDGRYVEVNDSFLRSTGYTRDEVVGRTSVDLGIWVDAGARHRFAAVLRRVGHVRDLELGFQRKDGTEGVALVNAEVVELNGTAHLMAVAHDITERRQADRARQVAEARYRELFDAAPVMYLITRLQEGVPVVADCNALFLQTLGYGADEVLGRPLADFYTEASRSALLGGGFDRALRGAFVAEERQLVTRDGRILEVLLRAAPERDADGQVLGTRATYIDVTQRRRAEERLRASEAQNRHLVDLVPGGIVVADADGVVRRANAEAQRLLGLAYDAADDRYARTLGPVVGEDHAPVGADDLPLARCLRSGEPQPPVTLGLREADGAMRWVHATAVPVRDPDTGVLTGAVLTCLDLTRRKAHEDEIVRAKEEAERLSRLKSAFLSNMSHEIRTPLTAILGFADILTDAVPEEHREYARLIGRSASRLLATLNSVLDLSMLEAGAVRLKRSRVEVNQEVEAKAALLRSLADRKGLRLRVEPHGEPIHASLDARCLDRVLNNLVGNAIKFTREGEVVVAVARQGENVVLEVRDTGIGIGAEFMPYLFSAFAQEAGGIDRSFEGSGLGLSITQRLVALHGGTIGVTSEVGAGSTFRVTLPLAAEPEADDVPPVPHATANAPGS